MKVQTFRYNRERGWSCPSFPAFDSSRTLVVAFGASEFADDPEPIRELTRAYPESTLIGCSTAGEIFGATVADGTLSVAVVRFDGTDVAVASAPVDSSGESFGAGKQVAEQLNGESLRSVIVLSDGHNVNGSELVRGINSVLPDSVIVTGGLAGDGDRFERTWVIKGGAAVPGYVSAAGLYGDRVRIGHGSKGGWDIFGPERRVTRSEGNVLYELDGRPALELYKMYLGELADGLPATGLLFPLALRCDASDDKSIVRTILAVDEEQQAMVFAGDIPERHLAQLMRANFDRLVDGASGAALMARNGDGPELDILAVAISCVGRRLVLGERTEDEIEATLDVLPDSTQQIGFYSYGEISPYANGRCDLHNQTMTLTTISED